MKKGDPKLLEAVNAWMKSVKTSGMMDKLEAKYIK
nr:transporter substrate-binding domain-containing protein [uncultured Duodenibacillus sp.]